MDLALAIAVAILSYLSSGMGYAFYKPETSDSISKGLSTSVPFRLRWKSLAVFVGIVFCSGTLVYRSGSVAEAAKIEEMKQNVLRLVADEADKFSQSQEAMFSALNNGMNLSKGFIGPGAALEAQVDSTSHYLNLVSDTISSWKQMRRKLAHAYPTQNGKSTILDDTFIRGTVERSSLAITRIHTSLAGSPSEDVIQEAYKDGISEAGAFMHSARADYDKISRKLNRELQRVSPDDEHAVKIAVRKVLIE